MEKLTRAQLELINYFNPKDAGYLHDRLATILEIVVVFSSELSEEDRASMYPMFRLLTILRGIEREKK